MIEFIWSVILNCKTLIDFSEYLDFLIVLLNTGSVMNAIQTMGSLDTEEEKGMAMSLVSGLGFGKLIKFYSN